MTIVGKGSIVSRDLQSRLQVIIANLDENTTEIATANEELASQ